MQAFCTTPLNPQGRRRTRKPCICECSINESQNVQPKFSRRSVLLGLVGLAILPGITEAKDSDTKETPQRITGVQTNSGLKYFDFQAGEGRSPKWGDYINIQYVLYTISPDGKSLEKQDSSYDNGPDGYLVHHGNGEHILGLEEALHSMKPGGRRRCIIPADIAFFKSNLGPVPIGPRQRKSLQSALDHGDGTVVMDIEMRQVWDDPDNRGYYDDLILSDEEIIQVWKEQKGVKVDSKGNPLDENGNALKKS